MLRRTHFSLLKLLSLCAFIFVASATQAATLKNFSATFDVRVLGFTVGEITQTFECDQQSHLCTLSSEAIPPSWAKRFINESAIEKIKLHQSEEQFTLLEYKKYLTREYDDRTEHKTFTIQRETEPKPQLRYLEKDTTWPNQALAFDVISLAYALQYQVLNKRPLTDFYLQDEKEQQAIQFSKTFVNDKLEPDYADDGITALRFEFSNAKIDAKLWLLPQYQYFPGKIEILNKEENRRIILEINKRPKFY